MYRTRIETAVGAVFGYQTQHKPTEEEIEKALTTVTDAPITKIIYRELDPFEEYIWAQQHVRSEAFSKKPLIERLQFIKHYDLV